MDESIPMPSETPQQSRLRSSAGVVTVKGQHYAVGLIWQPLQNLDDPILEVRETAESEMGADLYCLRPAATPQYGIGRTELEHRDGMPSLAAAVASVFTDQPSFCGVFKVDEGWWLVAIRNDLILAEEDVVFSNEEEAQRAYASMMAVPDWGLRIVPEEWQMEGAEYRDLSSVLQKARKIRLQPINAVRRTKFLLFITILILAALVWLGYSLFSLWKNVFPPEKIRVVEQPTVLPPVRPEPEKPKPWEKVVDLPAFFNQCWTSVYQIRSIVVPGWTMGNIECTVAGASTSWRLTDVQTGRLTWMNFGLDEYQLVNMKVDVSASGDSANGMFPFTKLPIVASVPKLTSLELEDDLKEIKQAMNLQGFQYSRQSLLDPPNRPDGTRPANQKSYTFYSFTLSSPFPPQEWEKFFGKFSGVELLRIQYTPSNGNNWTYEGRIYAK